MTLHSGWGTPFVSCPTAPSLQLPTVDPDAGTGSLSAGSTCRSVRPFTKNTPCRLLRPCSCRNPRPQLRSAMSRHTPIPTLPIGRRRRLLAALAVALSAVLSLAAPAVHAQDWEGSVLVDTDGDGEADGGGSLEIKGEGSVTYSIRLSDQPTDQNGNGIDGWWIILRVDGGIRADGEYNGIVWVPSVGWQFTKDNWDEWRTITISRGRPNSVDPPPYNGTPIRFEHEVWDHQSKCPFKGSPLTVQVVDRRRRRRRRRWWWWWWWWWYRAYPVHRGRRGERGRRRRVHRHPDGDPNRERDGELRHDERKRDRRQRLRLHVGNPDLPIRPEPGDDDDLGADDRGPRRRAERDLHRHPQQPQQRRDHSEPDGHRHHQRQ